MPSLIEDSPAPSVSVKGTDFESYERRTWPELQRLAKDVPEAGIHFQGMLEFLSLQHDIVADLSLDTYVYRRSKDVGTPVGDWFKELLREDAWFSSVVPNVSIVQARREAMAIDFCVSSEYYRNQNSLKALKVAQLLLRYASTLRSTFHGWSRNF